MPALKEKGTFGLIFIDAHADFYEPEKSTTGEVADMDLAIITGRGPDILTNINNLRPYVLDENVVHIGQRDWEETKKFGSQDIRETSIKCFDFEMIRQRGEAQVTKDVLTHISTLEVDGFWLHFDTDVLSEEVNPAVEYHLPGGLTFREVAYIIKNLMSTGRIVGMTVTIFNPRLDPEGNISRNIVECLGEAFNNS
jgi:arginase